MSRVDPATFTSFEPAGISGQLPAPSRTDEVVKKKQVVIRVIFIKLRGVKREKNANTGCFQAEQVVNKVVKRNCRWSKEKTGGHKGYFAKFQVVKRVIFIKLRVVKRKNRWS